jgi:TRAP-type C4-dicarboxylate transport system permease small subunit
MMLFFGISIIRTKIISKWIAVFAFITMGVMIIGNLEQFGVKFAFIFNRTGAKMLAAWLIITGAALLLNKDTSPKMKSENRVRN